MRKLLMGLVAVVLVAGCGDDDDAAPTGPGDVEDVAEADVRLLFEQDPSATFDRIHPDIQALATRADYVACQVAKQEPLPGDFSVDTEVDDVYEEGSLTWVSLTVSIDAGDESGSFPAAIAYADVDGVWRIVDIPDEEEDPDENCLPGYEAIVEELANA